MATVNSCKNGWQKRHSLRASTGSERVGRKWTNWQLKLNNSTKISFIIHPRCHPTESNASESITINNEAAFQIGFVSTRWLRVSYVDCILGDQPVLPGGYQLHQVIGALERRFRIAPQMHPASEDGCPAQFQNGFLADPFLHHQIFCLFVCLFFYTIWYTWGTQSPESEQPGDRHRHWNRVNGRRGRSHRRAAIRARRKWSVRSCDCKTPPASSSGIWKLEHGLVFYFFFVLNKKKKLGPFTFSCKEEWRQQESENADGREIS